MKARQSAHYDRLDKGGHFAAWEQPQLFSPERDPRLDPLSVARQGRYPRAPDLFGDSAQSVGISPAHGRRPVPRRPGSAGGISGVRPARSMRWATEIAASVASIYNCCLNLDWSARSGPLAFSCPWAALKCKCCSAVCSLGKTGIIRTDAAAALCCADQSAASRTVANEVRRPSHERKVPRGSPDPAALITGPVSRTASHSGDLILPPLAVALERLSEQLQCSFSISAREGLMHVPCDVVRKWHFQAV